VPNPTSRPARIGVAPPAPIVGAGVANNRSARVGAVGPACWQAAAEVRFREIALCGGALLLGW
jgi:hypothetical protein